MLFSIMAKIFRFLQKENLGKMLVLLMLMIIFSSAGIHYYEKLSLPDSFWWSIVTLTTVGYGDISPSSPAGRMIGILLMFFGIGLLGMFTATVAGIIVERKLKEDKGMTSYNFTNHIIICGWNGRAAAVLNELRADPRTSTTPVILIAELEGKPLDDEFLFFIKGEVSEETLKKAALPEAKTAIILGDDNLSENARDAKVVLATLTVETVNPNVYTIVQLADANNVKHCERAKADEIIVGSEFGSRLLARAARDHGISKVLSELLSSRIGNDLVKIPLPQDLNDKSFLEIFTVMKKEYDNTVLAIQKNDGTVVSNPDVNFKVPAGSYLIVIAGGNRKKNE